MSIFDRTCLILTGAWLWANLLDGIAGMRGAL